MFDMKNWMSKSFIVFSLLIPKTPHQDLDPQGTLRRTKKTDQTGPHITFL
jgi:hypothetical protein